MPHGRFFPTLIAAIAVTLALPYAAAASHDDGNFDQAPLRAEKRHFLKMYKVEKHLSLQSGEDGNDYYHQSSDPSKDTHVYCNPGDIAIDGMWRIDSVDQDEHGVQNLTDVNIYKSYADANDHSKWHFEIYNNSEGQAQVKLFATCLGKKTAENGHQHEWVLLNNPGHFYDAPSEVALGWTGSLNTSTSRCPSGYIAVAPGFGWVPAGGVDPSSYGELVRSHPWDTALDAWNWNFYVYDAGAVHLSLKCLKVKSTSASGHHHELLTKWRTDYTAPGPPTLVGFLEWVKGNKVETKTVGCWSHSKAMLHSFNAFDFEHPENGHRVWFLGMDPRPKKRAYKFWNKHHADQPVRVGAVCWNDRTGRKISG